MNLSQLLKFANNFLKTRALETGHSNILNLRSPQITPTCWFNIVRHVGSEMLNSFADHVG